MRNHKSPWSGIEVKNRGVASRIKLWKNGEVAGEILVDEEIEKEVMEQLFGTSTYSEVKTYYKIGETQ